MELSLALTRLQSGGANVEGLGFAIGADTLSRVVPDLLRGSTYPPPEPPSNPDVSEGKYTNIRYQYRLDISPGWFVDGADRDDVILGTFRTNVQVRVHAAPLGVLDPGDSIDRYRNNHTVLQADDWVNFGLEYQGPVTRDRWYDFNILSAVSGWEFLYRYRQNGTDFAGITHWFIITVNDTKILISITGQIPAILWSTTQYVIENLEIRSIINSIQF